MALVVVTPEMIHEAQRTWCIPIALLVNFSILQYLITLFHRRWREPRVLLLLGVAGIGVVALIPFATQDDATVGGMNDVSESCLALLLLVQTALVGSRESTSPALTPRVLHALADLLILYDCLVVALGVASVFRPTLATDFGGANAMNNVAEGLTLAFTFAYRFGLLCHAKSWRRLLREDRWELAWHVLFLTHEYLFMLIEARTGFSWEPIQAVYMRLSLSPCVWMTIGDHHEFHLRQAPQTRGGKQQQRQQTKKPNNQQAPLGTDREASARAYKICADDVALDTEQHDPSECTSRQH